MSAPPDLDALGAMPTEHWSALLTHLRAALRAVPDEALTPHLRRLRAAPAKKLAHGRVRQDLERALADGGALWVRFRERLADDAAAARQWVQALSADPAPQAPPPSSLVADDDLVPRLKERARSLRRERDDLARQVDGATARASAAETARDDAVSAAEALRDELAALTARVVAAADNEREAADRANRRRDREVADLQAQLRDARRGIEQARRDAADAREALARATEQAGRRSVVDPSEPITTVVPGRPSMVPGDIVPGTTGYAKALLPRGRKVVIDGYNVTKTHRGELQPAEQREWLIGLLSGAAARMGLDVTIVFDGAEGAGLRHQRSRGIRVEFSRGGLSADDDICFLVATIDPDVPVTVVTDDGELRQRLAPDHVDLLFTRELLWAVG